MANYWSDLEEIECKPNWGNVWAAPPTHITISITIPSPPEITFPLDFCFTPTGEVTVPSIVFTTP